MISVLLVALLWNYTALGATTIPSSYISDNYYKTGFFPRVSIPHAKIAVKVPARKPPTLAMTLNSDSRDLVGKVVSLSTTKNQHQLLAIPEEDSLAYKIKFNLIRMIIYRNVQKDLDQNINKLVGEVAEESPLSSLPESKKFDIFDAIIKIFTSVQHIGWALKKSVKLVLEKYYTPQAVEEVVESIVKTVTKETSFSDYFSASKEKNEKLIQKILENIRANDEIVLSVLDNYADNVCIITFYTVGHFFIYALPSEYRPKLLAKLQNVFLESKIPNTKPFFDEYTKIDGKNVFDPSVYPKKMWRYLHQVGFLMTRLSLEVLALGITGFMLVLSFLVGAALKLSHRNPIPQEFVYSIIERKLRKNLRT